MRHEQVIEAPVIEAFCQNHPHEQQQQQSWTTSPTFQSKSYLRQKSATKAALSEEERDVQIYRQRKRHHCLLRLRCCQLACDLRLS